jgi:hypothetical protein
MNETKHAHPKNDQAKLVEVLEAQAGVAGARQSKAETPKSESPKSIPVKSLCFFQPHPAFDARNSVAAEPAENKARVIIEFIPSLRHHRVERRKVGEPVRITMVHEALVASWEPLV